MRFFVFSRKLLLRIKCERDDQRKAGRALSQTPAPRIERVKLQPYQIR